MCGGTRQVYTRPTRCSGLEIVQYDAPALLRLLGDRFSLVREEEEVHTTPAGADQRFQYALLRFQP